MMKGKFYSHYAKCEVMQISKRKARSLWDDGVQLYLHPCNMSFDDARQRPVLVGQHNFDCLGFTFDRIVDYNESLICDISRGRYLHYYVKTSLLVLTDKN